MALSYATPLILTDPGYLFWAPLLSAEPTHAALASTYDADTWPIAWIPLGATEDGSKLAYDTKVEPIRVAEFFDPIRYATVERSGSISFMLTNYTLNTIKRVFNGGTLSTVSGAGVTLSSKYLLPTPGAEIRAMIGWESLDHTMRVVMYQAINSGTIEQAFQRAPAKALLPCTFNFEVPTSGQPIAYYAAGTARLGT
jgi:hypothetical protein